MKQHTVGKNRHKLSNVDINNRKCICSVCGETTLYIKNGRPRCATKAMFDQMGLKTYVGMKTIEEQFGKRPKYCPVCGRSGQYGRQLVLDHDHQTGELRGWLCQRCNLALGYLMDSPEVIQKLYQYIVKINIKKRKIQ